MSLGQSWHTGRLEVLLSWLVVVPLVWQWQLLVLVDWLDFASQVVVFFDGLSVMKVLLGV